MPTQGLLMVYTIYIEHDFTEPKKLAQEGPSANPRFVHGVIYVKLHNRTEPKLAQLPGTYETQKAVAESQKAT